MASDIRLLEELVNRAVNRLKQLSEERDELHQELEGLRQQLEQLGNARTSVDSDSVAWRAQREQVLTVLRDTLDELRSD